LALEHYNINAYGEVIGKWSGQKAVSCPSLISIIRSAESRV
jgi:hypothetical protein